MKFLTIGSAIVFWAITSIASEFTVEVRPSSQSTSQSSFTEDHLDLVLKNGKTIIDKEYFYSSYGSADARIVKDAKGVTYILLQYGEGRGTHVRSEFIAIYKAGKRLNKIVSFPLNGPAGETSDWEFKYSIEKPKGGGLRCLMTRHISGKGAFVYPEDSTRTLFIE